MKWVWVITLLAVAGCNGWSWPNQPATTENGTAPKEMIDSGGWVPTGNDDLDTIAICLLDFMQQGRMTSLVDGRRSTIVVHNKTNGPEFLSDEQIESETRRMSVLPGTVPSIQARNAEVHEVAWIPPGLPFFSSDLGTLPVDLKEMAEAMPKTYPRAFAAVWLWMPGYSEDGVGAMVRFTFAPTANGAIATYLLIKDDAGRWRISNRRLNYFMAPAQ